jgi:ribosome hibernation promoting factor
MAPAHYSPVPLSPFGTKDAFASIARLQPRNGSPSARSVERRSFMNLHVTGHHLEITPAIRAYVVNKLERVSRHFDHVIDVSVVLCVDKIRQIVEANVHLRGKEIHAQSVDPDMYAAIDALADKLDRQVQKHKEKLTDHRCDTEALRADGSAPAR